MSKPKNYFKTLTEDQIEAEIEWIVEARGEGMTWKQLAAHYNCSIRFLKKLLGK